MDKLLLIGGAAAAVIALLYFALDRTVAHKTSAGVVAAALGVYAASYFFSEHQKQNSTFEKERAEFKSDFNRERSEFLNQIDGRNDPSIAREARARRQRELDDELSEARIAATEDKKSARANAAETAAMLQKLKLRADQQVDQEEVLPEPKK